MRIANDEHLTTVKRRERLKRKSEALSTFKALADAWVAREARRQNWTAHYRTEVKASIRYHLAPLMLLPHLAGAHRWGCPSRRWAKPPARFLQAALQAPAATR